MHSVQENMAPITAKFLAYDIPLWPMSFRTSRAEEVFIGSLGSNPTLVSMPAVKTPKAPPRTKPVKETQKRNMLLLERRDVQTVQIKCRNVYYTTTTLRPLTDAWTDPGQTQNG